MLAASLLLAASCDDFALVAVVDRDGPVVMPPAIADGGGSADATNDASAFDAAASDAGRMVLDECGPGNSAGLSAEQVAKLMYAPTREPTQRFLYPYDGTVFPGGISAPLVMWEGPSSDSVLLRLRTKTFDYFGCLEPSAPGQVAIPQNAWDEAGAASSGAGDPIELRLTTLSDGQASGPISLSYTHARGGFQGSIYYMSYGSTGTASIWRLRARQAAEPLFSAVDCSGCHAIAANGTRLVGFSGGSGTAFRIDANTLLDPEPISALLPGGEYAGVYPDGSMYVATAHRSTVGTRSLAVAAIDAELFDVATGAAIPDANIPLGAMVPAFSPSGKLLAFNDFAIDDGHGLALMDFDANAKVASHYRQLLRDPASYPGWPSFLPDESAIVFAGGVSADFSALGARLLGRTERGPDSDLHIVDVTSQTASLLWRAMGFVRPGDPDADSY
ncbi:MAG TPA: hypothetical protein VK509_08395, partial [Polyangiales bacterium]|nr:hypothetical protein [Polyangiales bacterium]